MKFNLNLLVFVLGLLLFSAGVYLIYPPAAFVCAGVILMAISIFGGQRK